VKIARPVAEPLLGIPLPSEGVLSEVETVYNQLDEMRQILSDREITSIRIVVNPEKMVIKEAQRSFTYLNIYDYNVDAVIINRVIPDSVTDEYFRAWKEVQKKYREMILDSFSPIPIYEVPLFENEIVGTDMLERLGSELFGNEDSVAIKYNKRVQEVLKIGEEYVFSIYMPFTDKQELELNQKGDELIIKTHNLKRNIILPRTLQSLDIKSARFEEDILIIRFGGK
jgi:arsenite-transporting ATPase